MTPTSTDSGPFAKLKVIEVGSFVAGPAAITILSDFGAEVIKIEAPGQGDPWRQQKSGRPELPQTDQNYFWLLTGRNKKSVELDLKQKAGRDLLHRLVRDADVFLTNLPLATRPKLGIDYGQIEQINKRIIYASMTGYGEAGEEKDSTAFDTTAYWGRSGLMHLMQSDVETSPWRPPPAVGDHVAALAMFGAIVTALYRREETGLGANVGASLLASGAWTNGCYIQAGLCGAEYKHVPNRRFNPNALNNHYRCKDGGWLNLTMNAQQQIRDWSRFSLDIERPYLASDVRFRTLEARRQHAVELVAALDEAFAQKTIVEWRTLLDGRGYVLDVIAHPFAASESQQMKDSGAIVELKGVTGVARTVSSPFWIEGSPKVEAKCAPELGADTTAVLSTLGLDHATLSGLRETGVIGS